MRERGNTVVVVRSSVRSGGGARFELAIWDGQFFERYEAVRSGDLSFGMPIAPATDRLTPSDRAQARGRETAPPSPQRQPARLSDEGIARLLAVLETEGVVGSGGGTTPGAHRPPILPPHARLAGQPGIVGALGPYQLIEELSGAHVSGRRLFVGVGDPAGVAACLRRHERARPETLRLGSGDRALDGRDWWPVELSQLIHRAGEIGFSTWLSVFGVVPGHCARAWIETHPDVLLFERG